MIVLAATTDKLEIFLATATSFVLPCYTAWRDRNSTIFTAGRTVVNTNGSTPVDISGSPAASIQRLVDSITVFNADNSSAVVTVRLNANGTTFILFKATLGVGEMLMYQEGTGFYVMSNAGSIKSSTVQGNNPYSNAMNIIVLGADATNNNAVANTMQDIMGLNFAADIAATYYFKFVISYTAALATTGSRWSIMGPTFVRLSYTSEYTLTATTSTRNSELQAYDLPAACNASSIVAQNKAIIQGIITTNAAAGSIYPRFASEVAGSAIVAKAGSFVQYQRIT